MKRLFPTRSEWGSGWRIIGEMGGARDNSEVSAKRAAIIGVIGIAGLSLMCFGGPWFWVGVGWFAVFGVILGVA
jgi:hypothetical protein